MGISVLIAATLRNSKVEPGMLTLTSTLGEPSTCEIGTIDASGAVIPGVGNIIEVQDEASDVQFFGSANEVTTTIRDPTDAAQCRLTATDLNHATTRRNAGQYEWTDKTAGYIFADIASNSLSGDLSDVSLVETGPTIPYFKVDMSTVKDAFDALAQLAGMRWYVNELNQLLFFVPAASADAPFAISDGTNVSSISVRETREDYCNSVSARVGNALRDPDTEDFVGDSATQVFETAYPVGAAPTITLDGTVVTVGIGGVDTGKDWYWNENSKEIRQDSGGTVLTSGNTLSVTYTGIESIIIGVTDSGEISARATAEGNSGIYHKHLEIEQMLSRADALATIQGYMDARSELTYVLTVETNQAKEPDILALRPGQVLNFTAPGYGVTGLFLVRTRTLYHLMGATDVHAVQWGCRFEAVKGPILATFADLFKGGGGGSGISIGASGDSAGVSIDSAPVIYS